MEFRFQTTIDQKAMTAMAKGLRKTIRRKHSRRSHVFGVIVVIVGLLLTISGENGIEINVRSVVTWLAMLAIVVALICEDQLNGYFAGKKMLPGMEQDETCFGEEGYRTVTGLGETSWHYDNIDQIARLDNYYVFVYSKNHAQVYDRRTLSGGTQDEFEAFLAEKTGKTIRVIR